MDELSSSVLEFQDPYAVFLEAYREFISFNGFVSKLSWELPFSSSLLLFISEHLRFLIPIVIDMIMIVLLIILEKRELLI